jgi:hypothetical protein
MIDHLSEEVFSGYAEATGKALAPALGGHKSALFCDSWEVETRKIWTPDWKRVSWVNMVMT